MTPAYLTDIQVAETLGRKVTWLKNNRPMLEQEGFPRRDKLIGLTLAADVNAWLARRRVVADPVGTQISGSTTNITLEQLNDL